MTKTKTPKLSSLIKPLKFDWVNSDITDTLFKQPKEVSSDYKLFNFDRYISSEDALKEMEKEGYRPANVWELLGYAKNGWNNRDWVVALGSVGEVHGSRHVPALDRDGSKRRLDLRWFDGGWRADYRFLAVRNLSSDAKTSAPALGTSDALALEGRVKRIEDWIDGFQNALKSNPVDNGSKQT